MNTMPFSPHNSFSTTSSNKASPSSSRRELNQFNRHPSYHNPSTGMPSTLPDPSRISRSSCARRNHIDRQSIKDIEHSLQAPNTSQRRKRMGKRMLQLLSPEHAKATIQNDPASYNLSGSPHPRTPDGHSGRTPRKSHTPEYTRLPSPRNAGQHCRESSLRGDENAHAGNLQTSRDSGSGRLPSVHTILAERDRYTRTLAGR